ncbi:MAG TPA: N-formylglutamate amidohydrolase [Rhizomicrobium sp.]|nr:N-formylglutamate amidohydrolase [Rhizomicrobium sp.]
MDSLGRDLQDIDSPSRPEGGGDDVLEFLARAPFRLIRPERQRVPFVVASPHSGRAYPKGFLAQSRLPLEALRRSEDAFVDELFAPAAEFGAPLIAATFPRAYLDVNRAPAEFDPAMFETALPFPVDQASPRVHAGLGVIPRIVRDGAEIYRRKLTVEEAGRRLSLFYRPYHAALAALVEETVQQFGVAVVIDCHSMPSAAAVPDIVLGDRYGMSAAPLVMHLAEEALTAENFSVARNIPYAGGYTTQLHGRPSRSRHALQIEINRALYMDEDVIRPAPSFSRVRLSLRAALLALTALDPSRLLPLRHAAE